MSTGAKLAIVVGVVGLAGLLGIGLVAFGGVWLFGELRPHADLANEYLDAVRAGDTSLAGALACGELPDLDPEVASSRGQDLARVEVSSSGGVETGAVEGELELADGRRSRVTVRTTGVDDVLCVDRVDLAR